MKLVRIMTIAITSSIMVPQLAYAHVGLGDVHDALHGFGHPLTGVDHMLAMVSVGLLAAKLNGRALWAVPASFILMMVFGGMLGMAGIALPLAELGIGASVLVLGAIIAVPVILPVSIAIAIAATFAIFHGFAHGAEMPENASGVMFAIGFVLATALLHCLGIMSGLVIHRLSQNASQMMLKIAGGIVAFVGVVLLAG